MKKVVRLQEQWLVVLNSERNYQQQIESFDPLLSYYFTVIDELNKGDSYKLIQNLLAILKDFNLELGFDKKSFTLMPELLELDEMSDLKWTNLSPIATKTSRNSAQL